MALGCVFIPVLGIEADEALFASVPFFNKGNGLKDQILHPGVPLMLMSYLGTLKTWIYWPLLRLLPANVWTVRLPMLLVGAATVFLFYRLVDRSVGRRAAVMGTFLLAVDPLFLLTIAFDWGPVALEHFFLVTAALCLFTFGSQYGQRSTPSEPFWHSFLSGRERWLALGFFLLGLGLWNKAIFIWALAGLTVAALVTLWPFVGRELRVRTLALAAVAFLAGAAPLILFNLKESAATVGENAHFDTSEFTVKWAQVVRAIDGSSLFTFLASTESGSDKPVSALPAALEKITGAPHASGVSWALCGLLLLVPLWWRSRAAWFSIIFCTVAWLMMALTKGTGIGAHHTVLLWPLPTLFAAVVLARLPKYVGTSAAVVMVAMHLAVANQYVVDLQRRGTSVVWTDALFPLSDELARAERKTIYITDWGIWDSLNLLHKGQLDLRNAGGPLTPDQPSEAETKDLDRMLQDPDGLWVGHIPGREVIPNVGQHLDRRLQEVGKKRNILTIIRDSNGRPMFEIARVE